MGRLHIRKVPIQTSQVKYPQMLGFGAKRNNRRVAARAAILMLALVARSLFSTEKHRMVEGEALDVEAGPDSQC